MENREKSFYDEQDETIEQNEFQLNREISIYEISDTLNDENTEHNNNNNNDELLNDLYSYIPNEKKLCLIDKEIDEIPSQLIYEFGLKTQILDLTFNRLTTTLLNLNQFPYLEELILDNNLITHDTLFPCLANLRILSLNKNQITNIHILIDKVKALYTKLKYLSLLGNPICPDQLSIDLNDKTQEDNYDYLKYRRYIVHRLPSLKFLDCYEITQKERDVLMESNELFYFDTISYRDDYTRDVIITSRTQSNDKYTSLIENESRQAASESDSIERAQDKSSSKAEFGYCKYTYVGKQSEGNRFIKNDDL